MPKKADDRPPFTRWLAKCPQPVLYGPSGDTAMPDAELTIDTDALAKVAAWLAFNAAKQGKALEWPGGMDTTIIRARPIPDPERTKGKDDGKVPD